MASIASQLDRLLTQLVEDSEDKITVTFADGTRRMLDAGDCISLIHNDAGNIGRFEGAGRGLLVDLLNAILEV